MDELTIKELRAQTGMSQKEFAEHFDVNIRTLQGWERGKRMQDGMLSMMKRIVELEEELESVKHELKTEKALKQGK